MLLKSPGKINEFLRVLRKRDDGYHELITVMRALSLSDHLDIDIATEGAITDTLIVEGYSVLTDKSNLIIKAFDLFRDYTGWEVYFDVKLEKRIPIGAGLGGGSSNAASALYAANKLTGSTLSQHQLGVLGSRLGSDVPFFLLSQGAALCEGRGEIVQPLFRLNENPSREIILVCPPIYISTARIFSAYSGSKVVGKRGLNDLEPIACDLYPELENFKAVMDEFLENVTMSGSGSAFFGVLREGKELHAVQNELINRIPGSLVKRINFIERVANGWF